MASLRWPSKTDAQVALISLSTWCCSPDAVRAAWSVRIAPLTAEPSRNHRSEFQHPTPDGFIGDVEPPLREEFLDVPIAQGEAQIEPNRMLADHRRKAVAAVGYFSHRISLPLRRASGLSGYPDKAAPCHSGSGDARRRLPSPTELWRRLTCAHFRPVPLEGSGDRVQYTPFRRWVGPKVPCRY
jgi:hypothetical protein